MLNQRTLYGTGSQKGEIYDPRHQGMEARVTPLPITLRDLLDKSLLFSQRLYKFRGSGS